MHTEPHLVTIWNPWPADIRVDPKKGIHPDDCRDLVRWVSCIVGKDNVLSLYWKPKSKDTIIVEINDFNNHKGRILGEHPWIKVFTKVPVGDKQKSSKLYPCPLGNYAELQKQRWRETKVNEDWFKNWDPNRNRMVHMPYPKSNWCDLPDHHGIDEFCGKIPVSLFPEEEARRAKPKEPMMREDERSELTTPGAPRWNKAREEGKRIPNARVRPTPDPASVPQPKQRAARYYRKVEVVTTEQSMRAVLGPPPAPKPIVLDENGLPNLKPEQFDWFEDVEDQDDGAGWRLQEPPDWEFSQVSIAKKPSPSVNASDNAWYVGPSWDDDESEAPAPVASSSKAPERKPPPASPPPASKPGAWQKKPQPAGPKSSASAKPSPTASSKESDKEWQAAGKGKGKATP